MEHCCDLCAGKYSRKDNLLRHNVIAHNLYLYYCDLCDYKCNIKKKLVTHLETDHNFTFPIPRKICRRIECPLCNTKVNSYNNLHQHISDSHHTQLEVENFTFANERDFYEWKTEIEKSLSCQYIARRGQYTGKNTCKKYFVCQRSYSYTPSLKGTTRQRTQKRMSTNKIGSCCPSVIRVCISKPENIVSVTFVKTHVGHENEIKRMRIPKDERAKIAAKLREGVSFDRLISDIRTDKENGNSDRIRFIQKKDLHNIVRDFRIKYTSKLHPDDSASVNTLVQELNKLEPSPILHYRNDDDNFYLIIMTDFQKQMLKSFHVDNICVDGAHDLSAYALHLFTILTVDESGNGVPIAFCFSKKSDFNAILLFFQKIKEAVGLIATKVFTSDDSSRFYEAWSNVMGEPQHRLSCMWHLNKSWSKNLITKIKNPKKRDIVKKTLYQLATKCDDIKKFNVSLQMFLRELKNDEETNDFFNYFTNFYTPNIESWALCYRQHIRANTNIHLGNLHRKIKSIYSNRIHRNQYPSLDQVVYALFELIRDTMNDRMIEMAKKKAIEKILQIRESHSLSKQYMEVTIHEKGQSNIWLVTLPHNSAFSYRVQRVQEKCDDQFCILRCAECEVCVHTYRCSCPDNVIHLNVCQHIHKVCAQNNSEMSSNDETDCYIPIQEVIVVSEDIMYEKISVEEIDPRGNIKNKLEYLLNNLDNVMLDDEDYQKVEWYLDTISTIFENAKKDNKNSIY